MSGQHGFFANRESCALLHGDVREVLSLIPDNSVHCVVTSPPYYLLRDYQVSGQIGLEKTPAEFVAVMVDVFREVRRVLHEAGTCWVNLGDSYAGGGCGARDAERWPKQSRNDHMPTHAKKKTGAKPKDLLGIPWSVAFALRDDGWWLRSDCIWSKTNPMPSSVRDRPACSHEYVFLLTKSARYFYDIDAVREPHTMRSQRRLTPRANHPKGDGGRQAHTQPAYDTRLAEEAGPNGNPLGRNRRTVWTIATQPTRDAHFATFPEKLVEPCILAGTSEKGCCAECGAPWVRMVSVTYEKGYRSGHLGRYRGDAATGMGDRSNRPAMDKVVETTGWEPTCDCKAEVVPCTVLDPFAGSGTTGLVAAKLGRRAILIDLNRDYLRLAHRRLGGQ